MNTWCCHLSIAFMLIFSSMGVYASYHGSDMQLINNKTSFVLVEFKGSETTIFDHFVLAEIEENGILIPPAMRGDFEGRARVFIDDVDFQKALVEVYYPFSMNHELYEWRDNSRS